MNIRHVERRADYSDVDPKLEAEGQLEGSPSAMVFDHLYTLNAIADAPVFVNEIVLISAWEETP